LTIDKILSCRNNLERILDNLKEGIIAHDLKRRIFFFNQEAERITGFCREEVLGKDCHEALGGPFCGAQCSFCGPEPDLNERTEYSHTILTKERNLKNIDI
jgi:sigma-54 dependent transcriptional regulator, acetoin dehydrogenase operon transcriptional activator AcoR